MRYLSAEEILALHDLLIEQIGGSLGLREEGLLRSIAERPKTSFGGQEQFPTVFLKAAAYLEAIATYHVFADGNKRASAMVAEVFLRANGLDIPVFDIEEGEEFIIAVAQKQKTIIDIAAWLEKNSKKQ